METLQKEILNQRTATKGTHFDHLIGLCPVCHRNMMYSDSCFDPISKADYHIKCYKTVELK